MASHTVHRLTNLDTTKQVRLRQPKDEVRLETYVCPADSTASAISLSFTARRQVEVHVSCKSERA